MPIFFKITFFKKLSGILSECKTVLIQIKADVLSVFKGYQKVAGSKQRFKLQDTRKSRNFHQMGGGGVQSKEESKDKESIQSSTVRCDPGHHIGK